MKLNANQRLTAASPAKIEKAFKAAIKAFTEEEADNKNVKPTDWHYEDVFSLEDDPWLTLSKNKGKVFVNIDEWILAYTVIAKMAGTDYVQVSGLKKNVTSIPADDADKAWNEYNKAMAAIMAKVQTTSEALLNKALAFFTKGDALVTPNESGYNE